MSVSADSGSAPLSRSRFLLLYVLPTVVLLLLVVWPLARGSDTLFFRDVSNTHMEMKWWQTEAMREGFIPLIDPYRSGGQPHLGNPNTVALYPDNLLYLVAPMLWAFNAHFWLHLLLAPFGAYWLARRLGLGRSGAWAAGIFYGASGYFLSTLNLYNLVAGAALIPAFSASILCLCSPSSRRWHVAAAAGLWCLLILAGDPITAALAFAIAVSLLWVGRPSRAHLWRLAAALGAGTLLAAPQLVEFLRIVELSFRGHRGYSAAGPSWHIAAVLEWFIPFAFGPPDLSFWGHRFYSWNKPLFYSFYPGLLGMACFAVGVWSRSTNSRCARWALALMAFGVFLSLGEHNPIVTWLLGLPGLDVLRFPVKAWPMVAVPAAVLAGLGFERCASAGGPALLRRAAIILALACLTGWLAVSIAGVRLEGLLSSWMPSALAVTPLAEGERARWAGHLLQGAALSLMFVLATAVRERAFRSLLPLLLAVHTIVQLALLAPLYRSEETAMFAAPPAAALAVPEEAIVAHGAAGDLFGPVPVPMTEYRSEDPRWMQRQLYNESYPYVGMMARRRFEFVLSPEGLDAFLTRAATEAFQILTDAQRVRLLKASGVEWLYMKREFEDDVDDVELVGRYPSLGSDVFVYRLTGSAAPVQFVGNLLPSENLNQALAAVTSADFRPLEEVVIAGSDVSGSGLGGTVAPGPESAVPESWSWIVTAEGSGALLIQRSHLPIYRLEVDGKEVEPAVGNLHRLAVPLDAGRHVVRLWADRRPLRWSFVIMLLTGVALVLYVAGIPGRRLRLEHDA